LNAQSTAKSFRNSLLLADLEANSVADYLRQLMLNDEGRQKTEEEEIKSQNADVLRTIDKAIAAVQVRAEERRRREQEEEQMRLEKLEQERKRVFKQTLQK
jgi:hypothetical protein